MVTVFSLGVCHLATGAWQSVLGTFHQPHRARSGPSQRILPLCYQYCLDFTLSRDWASRDSIWAFGKGGQQVIPHPHRHFRSRCYRLLTWPLLKELAIPWLQRLFSPTPHKSSSAQTHVRMDLLWKSRSHCDNWLSLECIPCCLNPCLYSWLEVVFAVI